MRFFALSLAGLLLSCYAAAQDRNVRFAQEVRTFFDAKQGLPDSDTWAVCMDPQARPVALTAKGLARFDGDAWTPMPNPPFTAKFLAISKDAMYVAGDQSAAIFQKDAWGSFPSVEGRTFTCLYATTRSAGLLIGTDQGLMTYSDGMLVPVPGPEHKICAMAHGLDGELAVGTDEGLYVRRRGETNWTLLLPEDDKRRWALRDVYAVTYDNAGRLWFGAREGAGVREDAGWRLFEGKDGLPCNEFTMAAPGDAESVWFATRRGAIRYENGRFAFRFSNRWLPNDRVNGLVVEPNGTAWMATSWGFSHIERRPMSLDEKAAYFLQQTESRHNRDGFISDCWMPDVLDINSWKPRVSDNEGMYTSCYGASQAFRYAATKDAEALALVRRSFDACRRLVEITGTGMPARVIIPEDWYEPVDELFGEAFNAKYAKNDPFWKNLLPRFVYTDDGKQRWKCDTSGDELAGHFFFYGLYYDLAAETKDEKEAIQSVVRTLTDHLIDNEFVLCDYDGSPTRWGNFSPEYLNSPRGWEQRGLNSMMMLSFLKVAEHITGDAKYAETARRLRDEYQYHINAMQSKMYFPPDYVAPWDNNLCLLSWYGLIKYEDQPDLLLLWRQGLEHAWLHISKQKNPLWNLLYQASAARFDERRKEGFFDHAYRGMEVYAHQILAQFEETDPCLSDTLESLRGLPLDLIGYRIDNTKRLDIVFDPTPGQEPDVGWHFDGRAIPVEERGHVRQDRDGFALDTNADDCLAEHEGTLFLLPYWLGVYHGFIK